MRENAGDDKDAGLSYQVIGTAELSSYTDRGILIRKQLMPIVRNKFRDEPGILAEWESAAHITRPGHRKKETAAG